MYHRVSKLSLDPWALAVSPQNFEAQMRALHHSRLVLSLPDFVARLAEKRLPDNAVAITFDDGYADNLKFAKPVLARYGLPATLFLTTGDWLRGGMLWWDELARLILDHRGSARESIRIGEEQVELGWSVDLLLDVKRGLQRREWRGWDPPTTERQRAFVAVWSRLKAVGEGERARVMGVLRSRLGPVRSDEDLTMTEAQLAELLADRVFTLGGHTESHASLPVLSEDERAQELGTCLAKCEQYSGDKVPGFAYPYGDFDANTRDSVARSGFLWACTTREDAVRDDEDVYALPRIAAPNVGGRGFLRAIAC
jgi:peptidoglycan/xylan/chitin deacetylase (PgdA/CDA1 family)